MIKFLEEKGYEPTPYTITYAPQMINWNYSYVCNLNCKHCYSRTRKSSNVASTADKYKIVDNIIKNNVYWVNLGGGEPILEKDIYEIIKKMADKNIHVSLSTNGTYLNEERVKKLANSNLTRVSISLDNSNPTKHNANRGFDESYNDVMKGIDLCRKYDIQVMISTTITTQNYRDIENIIKIGIEKDWCAISLKRIKMTGNAKENSYLELNEKQVEELYDRVIMLKNKYPDFTINFNYGQERISDLDGGCPCGRTALAIMPNGDVIPCVYNDVLYLGNAITDDLSDIFHSPKLEYLRDNFKCLGSALVREMDKDVFIK